jgi:YVTN family beta-propeller protein
VIRIATMALLLATLAFGQWLGEKLPLRDTFGLPAGHQSLAYNNRNHTIYLSGDECDSILIIDADGCKSIGRVAVGGGVQAMCYNPTENRLYCAYSQADTVVVLDGTTHQILARIGVGDSAGSFCYDSIDNKMYVRNRGSGSVSVIDCRHDSVVATADIGGGSPDAPNGMCFVAAHLAVYVASSSDSSVVVIDCSVDTIVARVLLGQAPGALCYNPTNDRVYCACGNRILCGIDAASNHVVSVIPRGYALSLACDPARNVLFVPDGGCLVVLDCSADTVIAGIELPHAGYDFVGYEPVGAKVYIADDVGSCWTPGSITVLDGESYEVLNWFTAFYTVDAFCMTQALGRLFVAGGADEGVHAVAIDAGTGRLRGIWREGFHAVRLLAAPKSSKLYCLDDAYLVSVVDAMAGALRASVPVAGYPVAACINTVDNKVYVATVDWDILGKVAVLDGAGDTLMAEVATYTDPILLAFDSTDDVLCVAGDGSHNLQAIDGKLDLLVDSLWVDEYPVGLLFSEESRKFYSLGCDSTVTVFDPVSFSVDKCITVGTCLEHSAMNSNGSRLYGGGPGRRAVFVIDCARETLARTIPVFGPPVTLRYDSQHDRVYSYTTAEGGMLSVIDCSRDTVVTNIAVTALCIYCDSATDAVYCLGPDGVTVIDGLTCAILKTLPTDLRPACITSAPGWPCVYVCDDNNPRISVIHKAAGPAEMGVQAAADVQATVVRGRLDWTGSLAAMYDMGGRRVLDVHRGANNVSGLNPGVYFIRQNGVPPGTYGRKVVITR